MTEPLSAEQELEGLRDQIISNRYDWAAHVHEANIHRRQAERLNQDHAAMQSRVKVLELRVRELGLRALPGIGGPP